MTTTNMHYTNVLKNFQTKYDSYVELKGSDEPKIAKLNDCDNNRKVTNWVPSFRRTLSNYYGSHGPLSYVLREDAAVWPEANDPLGAIGYYSNAKGNLISVLFTRLLHTGSIYKNYNESIFMKIKEAVQGTSVESTIKSFARAKDGRGAYFALITNRAGETKYSSIAKKVHQPSTTY